MFISHGHHDHLDPPSLRRIPGKPTVIVPRGFGKIGGEGGPRPGRGGRARRPADDRPRPVRGHVRGALGPPRAASGRPARRSAASSRGRGPSTSPATPTCSPRWASSPGGSTSRMLPVWGWGPTIGEGHLDPDARRRGRGDPPAAARHPDPLGHLLPGGHAAGRAGAVRRRRAASSPTALAGFAPDVEARVLAPGEARPAEPVAARRPETRTNPAGAGGVHAWERGGGRSAERDVGDDPERGEEESRGRAGGRGRRRRRRPRGTGSVRTPGVSFLVLVEWPSGGAGR